jgi:hypothetical protein
MIEVEKIQKILQDFRLDYRGFPSLDRTPTPINIYDTIIECINIIPTIFEQLPSRTHHTLNSYSGKHILERKLDKNVSNGEFIVAMIYLEYKFKFIPKSLNCVFLCKEKK